jgi:hypothetical protein
MCQIDIEGVITAAVVYEALALTKPKHSWLRLLLEYGFLTFYLVVPAAILGWFGVKGLVYNLWGSVNDLLAVLGCEAVIAVPAGAVVVGVRKQRWAQGVKRSLEGTARFSVTAEGISISSDGVPHTGDWPCYLGFLMAQRGILCPRNEPAGFLLIPI